MTTRGAAGQGDPSPTSRPAGGLAVVAGASGGLGSALRECLAADPRFASVLGYSRRFSPPLDLLDESSIVRAADAIAATGLPLRLVVDATGFLHGAGRMPEKRLRDLDPGHLAHAFAINAIGPALLMKHLLPRLAPAGRSVFATLSAKVGSIGDNRLGGWYGYRASKAALNQFVRTAAIELKRTHGEAICVAIHPGTVETPLSAPFARDGLDVQSPEVAAERILATLDRLGTDASGGFFDARGRPLPW